MLTLCAMPAHKVPLAIEQGATFDPVYTWMTGPKAAPSLVDLTGCQARMQIRSDIDSETVLLELTTENGGIVLGGAAGTLQIIIAAEQSAGFAWDSGVYDLEIVFADGRVVRRLSGSVLISPEVTRV